MTNSADPDQLASSEANWSGSTLFAKTGHDLFSMRRAKILVIVTENSPKQNRVKKKSEIGENMNCTSMSHIDGGLNCSPLDAVVIQVWSS